MACEQTKLVCSVLKTPSPHGMPLEWKIGELQFDQVLAVREKMEVNLEVMECHSGQVLCFSQKRVRS